MMEDFGGPGPEDWANGAAILAAGLVREAAALAQAAAALRAAMQPVPGEAPDVRRGRMAMGAASEAAGRAALALEAAAAVTAPGSLEDRARRIAETAKRAGLPAAGLPPLLRAAALGTATDDAAARIAAAILAQELAQRLAAG